MNIDNLIELLRNSVIAQDTNILYDPEFDQSKGALLDVIKFALLGVAPNLSIEKIPSDSIYMVILYAKRELYYRLATKSAPLYKVANKEMTIDKSERFDHYYKLIGLINEEIALSIANGNGGVLQSSETVITGRYFTTRNYNLAERPLVTLLQIDKVTKDTAYFKWEIEQMVMFKCYQIAILEGEEDVVDIYNGYTLNPKATIIDTLYDLHTQAYKITDLTSNTYYTLAVLVQEQNGLIGYKQVTFKTKEYIESTTLRSDLDVFDGK